jgi:hypothetical protein
MCRLFVSKLALQHFEKSICTSLLQVYGDIIMPSPETATLIGFFIQPSWTFHNAFRPFGKYPAPHLEHANCHRSRHQRIGDRLLLFDGNAQPNGPSRLMGFAQRSLIHCAQTMSSQRNQSVNARKGTALRARSERCTRDNGEQAGVSAALRFFVIADCDFHSSLHSQPLLIQRWYYSPLG